MHIVKNSLQVYPTFESTGTNTLDPFRIRLRSSDFRSGSAGVVRIRLAEILSISVSWDEVLPAEDNTFSFLPAADRWIMFIFG